MNVTAQVKQELQELKKCGTRVKKAALEYPDLHSSEMEEFYTNGMSVSEIADYVLMVS